MLGPPLSEELLHIEVAHTLTTLKLVDANLDVAAEALEFDAIQFNAVAVGIQRLSDEFVRPRVVARGDCDLDELIEFHGKLNSKLAHEAESRFRHFIGQDCRLASSTTRRRVASQM